MTGDAGIVTVTKKLCVALRLGVPLSATFKRTSWFAPTCDMVGRHENTPVPASSVAPPGSVSGLNVNDCHGWSGSVAVFVMVSRMPALMTRLEIADNVGATLAVCIAAISLAFIGPE